MILTKNKNFNSPRKYKFAFENQVLKQYWYKGNDKAKILAWDCQASNIKDIYTSKSSVYIKYIIFSKYVNGISQTKEIPLDSHADAQNFCAWLKKEIGFNYGI